jgi:hypothetical protein
MEEGDPSLALPLMTTFYISQIIRYLKKLFESMFYKVLVHEQEITFGELARTRARFLASARNDSAVEEHMG